MEVILTTYNTWDYPPSMYFPILSSYFFRILPKRPMMMPCCNASRVILIWLDPPRPRQVEGMSLSFWKESPHLEWADTNNLHVSCIQKNRTFTPFFGWDFQKEIKKKNLFWSHHPPAPRKFQAFSVTWFLLLLLCHSGCILLGHISLVYPPNPAKMPIVTIFEVFYVRIPHPKKCNHLGKWRASILGE